MDFFSHLTYWHWWALAIAFLAFEMIAPSTFFYWPAIAAAVVGIVLWAAPHTSVLAQGLGFFVLALMMLGIWFILPIRKRLANTAPHLNRRAAQYVGRRASVVEAFNNGRGAVELDDTRWPAEAAGGEDFALGDHVEIKSVEGTLLKVGPRGAP